MKYELRKLGQEGAEKVLADCDEDERRRLIRYEYFQCPDYQSWAVCDEDNSYFLSTLVHGDPRQGRSDYLFRYHGVTHIVKTNGRNPFIISLGDFNLESNVIALFKFDLEAAFRTYGRHGSGVDHNELFELNFVSGDQ